MAKRPEIKKTTENINRLGLNDVKELTEQLSEKTTDQASNNREITEGNDKNKKEPNSKNRVKLTTMINPTLRDRLKLIANEQRTNFSNILEDAIKQYLDGQ